VCEAVMLGKPLYERMVTVSGCVRRPANLLVRIGTPISALIEACGGITEPEAAVVMGGPMMGLPLPSLDFPVLKGTSGLTVLGPDQLRNARFEPCIRCGRCVDICPMFLQPYLYALLADRGRHEDCEAAAVMDCIECGACTYTCPANRPLTQWIKLAKTKILQSRKK
ncbi:MAG TPA: SLBB domain-containing protein, partial [bacterium]|nr:SLBB domain-containing protein [bacterium]